MRYARAIFSMRSFWPVVALVTVYALSWEINGVIVAIVEGRLGAWLEKVGSDWLSYMLVGTAMYAPCAIVSAFGPERGWRRMALLAATVFLVTPLGVAVRLLWMQWLGPTPAHWPAEFVLRMGLRFLTVAGLLLLVSEFHRREQRMLAEMHRAEVDRINLERQMAQARLQVLQAQIEPHFLFNTLANVRRLYETDPAAGHRMLDNLIRYFEIALPRMREAATTLAREASLIESYLNIQQIRMGRRLRFRLEVPAELRDIEVPPMMLLTLVENAIKHGLNPLPGGGAVELTAAIDGERLRIDVTDTGRGVSAESGAGTGIANVRARLAAIYGADAHLTLRSNVPQGIVATLSMPFARPAH